MYPNTITHTEELIELINQSAPKVMDIVKELYDNFDVRKMIEGVRYYVGQSDILKRDIYTYVNGQKTVDEEATNEKLVSGFHKILVDQKTAYLVGEPMVFGSRSDNKKNLELLQELIGERWEDVIPELIKSASNKGKEWLHPFVNEEGEFDYMIVPAEQFIPIYDYSKHKRLVAGIRFYQLEEVIKLELWTESDVTYYEIINNSIFLDSNENPNPAPHFTDVEEIEWNSWGKVPFIKFANNEEELSDLHFYKSLIDGYDLLVSDAQNTLSDMQSLIWALRGYDGEDLGEFMANLKRYKAIKLSSDGGLDTVKAEVPVDSYNAQTDKLKENIYAFGQGVNPSPDVIGDAPSGVALANLYSLLDMKASILERKFTLSLRKFMWFIEEYAKQAKLGEFDYRDITFTFNKMLLTNEAEIVDMALKSQGIISDETIMENHPWVKDAAQERRRIEENFLKQLDQLDNYNSTFSQRQGGGGVNAQE